MKLIRNTLFILALASFFSSNAFGGEESYTFKAAPEFTLRSTKGKKVSLSDYKGSVVLINFWATWCAPCIQELPSLQRIHDDLNKEGFTVLAINVDEARHKSGIKPLIKKMNLTFPILLDSTSSVMSLYNPQMNIPFSVVVNKKGNIYAYFNGYHKGLENEIKKAIEEMLDEK